MTAVSLIELKYIVNLRKNSGYVCDSSVERLPGMLEALGSSLVQAQQNLTFI